MAEARALARRAKQAWPVELDPSLGVFGPEVAVKGLYSSLIPELSQPAFE